MATYNKTEVHEGLGTFNFTIPEAGQYIIGGPINIANLSNSDKQSQLVVTVSVNGGAAIYTGVASAEGFSTGSTMAAGDIFNVTLSSSAAADQGLNVIKSTITVYGI